MKYIVIRSTNDLANGAICEDPMIHRFLILRRGGKITGFVPTQISIEDGLIRVSGTSMSLILSKEVTDNAEDN
jgi:hypothetical protein